MRHIHGGQPFANLKAQLERLGCDGYATKPIERKKLIAMIKDYLPAANRAEQLRSFQDARATYAS